MKLLINFLTYGMAIFALIGSIYYTFLTKDAFFIITGILFVFISLLMNYFLKNYLDYKNNGKEFSFPLFYEF